MTDDREQPLSSGEMPGQTRETGQKASDLQPDPGIQWPEDPGVLKKPQPKVPSRAAESHGLWNRYLDWFEENDMLVWGLLVGVALLGASFYLYGQATTDRVSGVAIVERVLGQETRCEQFGEERRCAKWTRAAGSFYAGSAVGEEATGRFNEWIKGNFSVGSGLVIYFSPDDPQCCDRTSPNTRWFYWVAAITAGLVVSALTAVAAIGHARRR